MQSRRGVAKFTGSARGFFGVPAEEFGRIGNLAPRIAQRLAVLKRDQPGKFFGVFRHQGEPATQDFRALTRRRVAPTLRSFVRSINSAHRVVDGCIRNAAQRVATGRIDHGNAVTCLPFTVNIQAMNVKAGIGEIGV